MTEPGYYDVIYDYWTTSGKICTDTFWFGVLFERGSMTSDENKPCFTPIMPNFCALHRKIIQPEQFGYEIR
jgi:hypothetical protein